MATRRHFAAGASVAGAAALFGMNGVALAAPGPGDLRGARLESANALFGLLNVLVSNVAVLNDVNALNGALNGLTISNVKVIDLSHSLHGDTVHVLSDLVDVANNFNHSNILSNILINLQNNTILSNIIQHSFNKNQVFVPIAVDLLSAPTTIYVVRQH